VKVLTDDMQLLSGDDAVEYLAGPDATIHKAATEGQTVEIRRQDDGSAEYFIGGRSVAKTAAPDVWNIPKPKVERRDGVIVASGHGITVSCESADHAWFGWQAAIYKAVALGLAAKRAEFMVYALERNHG
jgi:hypothetical protein